MVKIKVKKLNIDAVMPKFMNKGDAGADLTAVSYEVINDIIVYGTGLAFDIPEGYHLKLFPRSSVFKKQLTLANSTGIIDTNFKGELKVLFRMTNYLNLIEKLKQEDFDKYVGHILTYSIGDRIAQLIVEKNIDTDYIEVEELDMSNDRGGGMGSTDGK